jgi:hypothetical protein
MLYMLATKEIAKNNNTENTAVIFKLAPEWTVTSNCCSEVGSLHDFPVVIKLESVLPGKYLRSIPLRWQW